MSPFNNTIFLTPYVSIPDHERPLGRDEDLQELTRRLQEAGQLVVVKGLGGIGKSTLARFFVDSHRQQYRHIAWVKVANGLPAGFSQDTYLHGKLTLDLSQIPHEYDRFKACLTALEKLEGPNLLVLDNAVQDVASQNYRRNTPNTPRWQVLLTGRHELNGYSKMELGKLSNDAARQLFERCYQKPVADETWQELYALTDGHALSLELFGKSLHKTLGRLGPEGLVQRLKEKKLDDPVLQQWITSGHSEDETTVYKHLLVTFKLSEFGEYSNWLFKQFVALPLMPHRFDDLVALLQIDEEGKDDLHNALLFMEETGWLQREGDGFLMHPMVQQVGYYRLNPTDEDVTILVEIITAVLNLDQAHDNPVDKFQLIPFGDVLLSNIVWENKEAKAILQNNLAGIYWQMGNYLKAVELFEASMASDIENLGEKHPRVAIRKSNLANVYGEMGESKKARDLLEQALDSDLENFEEKHPKVAIRRSNLAIIYSDLGEYEKARNLLEQALASDIESFGKKHPNLAIHRSNLANVYSKLGKYIKARELLEQALASDLETFVEKHPNVATHLNNIAWTYRNEGKWQKSAKYFQKAYEIRISTLGGSHPDTMSAKQSLAFVQAQLSKTTLPNSNLRKKHKKP